MRKKFTPGKRYAILALSAVMLAGCANSSGTKTTQAETTVSETTESQTEASEVQADGIQQVLFREPKRTESTATSEFRTRRRRSASCRQRR